MVAPFYNAASKLKVGEISGIVKTQFGFHIIKLTARKDASNIPLKDVKDRIKQQLQSQKLMKTIIPAMVEKAKKTLKVKIFLNKI